ncbi:MAG TPA: DUF5808 domain-containing protein [Ktedonobacteraceae bacterium]|jgi:hypothetical protein
MKRKRHSRANTFIGAVSGAIAIMLVGAAIWDQLRRPPTERTWYGTVLNVPYDFRIPTAERLQKAFWNSDDTRVLVPQAFGVGWTINFYPLLYPRTAH